MTKQTTKTTTKEKKLRRSGKEELYCVDKRIKDIKRIFKELKKEEEQLENKRMHLMVNHKLYLTDLTKWKGLHVNKISVVYVLNGTVMVHIFSDKDVTLIDHDGHLRVEGIDHPFIHWDKDTENYVMHIRGTGHYLCERDVEILGFYDLETGSKLPEMWG